MVHLQVEPVSKLNSGKSNNMSIQFDVFVLKNLTVCWVGFGGGFSGLGLSFRFGLCDAILFDGAGSADVDGTGEVSKRIGL